MIYYTNNIRVCICEILYLIYFTFHEGICFHRPFFHVPPSLPTLPLCSTVIGFLLRANYPYVFQLDICYFLSFMFMFYFFPYSRSEKILLYLYFFWWASLSKILFRSINLAENYMLFVISSLYIYLYLYI